MIRHICGSQALLTVWLNKKMSVANFRSTLTETKTCKNTNKFPIRFNALQFPLYVYTRVSCVRWRILHMHTKPSTLSSQHDVSIIKLLYEQCSRLQIYLALNALDRCRQQICPHVDFYTTLTFKANLNHLHSTVSGRAELCLMSNSYIFRKTNKERNWTSELNEIWFNSHARLEKRKRSSRDETCATRCSCLTCSCNAQLLCAVDIRRRLAALVVLGIHLKLGDSEVWESWMWK